jgi:HEAT repeat protein
MIETYLSSPDPHEVRRGLDLVRREISRIGSSESKPLFEMVSALFYIDPLDRPDLAPLLDEAISLVVGFGNWVIPFLVTRLDAGDVKAQIAVAQALGRIGADAIDPLIATYRSSDAPTHRGFVLYALSKIKSPKIIKATELALVAAASTDIELRDTATRAIGKFAESIPPAALREELRIALIERLQKNLADSNAGIRAKAIRSLGKLAQFGHFQDQERERLRMTCLTLLGKDDSFEWDRAYIVRKEAEVALQWVSEQVCTTAS